MADAAAVASAARARANVSPGARLQADGLWRGGLVSATLAQLRERLARVKAQQAQRLTAYNLTHSATLCCDVCGMPALEGAARCTVHVEAPEHAAPERVRMCEYCRERPATGVWELQGRAFGRIWTRRESLCAACGFGATDRRTMTPCAMCKLGYQHDKCERGFVRYVLACSLVASGYASAGAHAPEPHGKKRTQPVEIREIALQLARVRKALEKFQRTRR